MRNVAASSWTLATLTVTTGPWEVVFFFSSIRYRHDVKLSGVSVPDSSPLCVSQDDVLSCPTHREAALTRRVPVEQLAKRRIRAVPSICSRWGASSFTRVAARESCIATDSMPPPHHLFSQAKAVERLKQGGARRLRYSARSWISYRHASLQRPPTSHVQKVPERS